MKKLYALAIVPFLAFGAGYAVHDPQAKVIRQTVSKVQAEPVHHIGDRQSDPSSYMTLSAVHTQRQVTGSMSAAPVDSQVVTFQLDTNVDQAQLMHQSLIYTSDGQYLKPTDGPYQVSCSATCISFITSPDVQVDTFIYKDFSWQL